MQRFRIVLLIATIALAIPSTAFANLGSDLRDAAEEGDLAQVKELLDKGADVNAESFWLSTPLSLSSENGHIDIARILIKKGANMRGMSGKRALRGATIKGRYEIVKLLIKNGADINAQDGSRATALMHAASLGYENIAKLLLDNGANPNIEDREGHTATWVARRDGHTQIVELLKNPPQKETEVAQADTNTGSAGSRSSGSSGSGASDEPRKIDIDRVFVNVVKIGDTEMVRKLLAKGANPSVDDDYPLKIASEKGYKEIVKLLLDAGVDVNDVGKDTRFIKHSALYFAASSGFVDIVKMLLKHGADINLGKNGFSTFSTPIIVATRNCHLAVVKVLIDNGANLKGTPGIAGSMGSDCKKVEELIAITEAKQLLNE